MTMTMTAEPIPSVDDDRAVMKHTRQRRELEDKQKAARARLTDLRAEETRLQRERHEAKVAFALGDRADAGDDATRVARLAALGDDIVRATADDAAIIDALARTAVIAEGVRAQVQAKRREQQIAQAETILCQMATHLEHLCALNVSLIPFADGSRVTTFSTDLFDGMLQAVQRQIHR